MAQRLRSGRIACSSAVWLAGSLVITNPATTLSAERSAPLLSGEDILGAGTAGITQGGMSGSSGSILYPEQILALDVQDAAEPGAVPDSRVQAWSKIYRFVVVPLTVAVRANQGTAPKSVIINAAFRNIGQLPKQSIIIDIFPATAFKAEPIQGNASI